MIWDLPTGTIDLAAGLPWRDDAEGVSLRSSRVAHRAAWSWCPSASSRDAPAASLRSKVAIDCTADHCVVGGRSAGEVVVWRVMLRDGRLDRVDTPRTVATTADLDRPMVAVSAASPQDAVAVAESS
ncbi:hypothetical protein [Janibacter sp. GXQ6167]|uniref:hypothetical protein n=1 Tax=Janibacter sp. GXQ6167 TaxID=3240791 RepID=UPI003526ADB4